MSTTLPPSEPDAGERDRSPSPFLRRARKRVPTAVWYALAAVGVAFAVILIQLAIYTRGREPRDARAIVERELTTNVLQPGERIVRMVPVFRRVGADYFRQTRGILALTDRRLIYLGAPPRDITGASGGAPTFDQRDYRIDTLVTVKGSFALLGLARALKIASPYENDVKLAIPSGNWDNAKLLRQAWAARHQRLEQIGAWGQKVREARTQLQKELEEYRRQPVYHVVRPGDAISSIASWYEVPVEQIAQQNNIVNNRIVVGQRLLIRPGSS